MVELGAQSSQGFAMLQCHVITMTVILTVDFDVLQKV